MEPANLLIKPFRENTTNCLHCGVSLQSHGYAVGWGGGVSRTELGMFMFESFVCNGRVTAAAQGIRPYPKIQVSILA
jgi:hypothetical protein